MRVLVAGCGYVGGALARELVAAGHAVYGLSRSGAQVPAGAVAVRADLSDRASLVALPTALDVVVYATGAVASTDAAYVDAYVRGPENLLAALAARGEPPRRWLYASSTGVFGPAGAGEWVDEATPPAPQGFSGARVLEGEELLRAAAVVCTAVRFGGIYGPGRTRLVEGVRRGTLEQHEGAPEITNRIHRDDCAGVLAHVMALAAPAPVYVAVDDEPADRNAVLRFIAAELGLPPPPLRQAPERRPGPGVGAGRRCSNRLLRESGYRFRFPTFREGYRALIAIDTAAAFR